MHSQHIIDKATMEFLLPPKNTRTPLFYGLPKIHKPDCPLHPVVSGCDGPTDHLSFYINHFIQYLANNLSSHIKDTKHFINLLEKLLPLLTNALLVTADVTSLNTNIPHEDSTAAVIHFMEEYKHLLPINFSPPHIVCIMLDFILKHNTFNFMDTHPPNPLHIHGNKDDSLLCQSLHGQRRTHHYPNILPLNLLLETFH